MFFDDSRPDRKKRAMKLSGERRVTNLANSPIPPAKSYELFTPEEINNGGHRELGFDAESFPNYFEVGFKCSVTGKVMCFEDHPTHGYLINNASVAPGQWTSQLGFMLNRFLCIGFNSWDYDLIVCFLAVQGVRAPTLFQVTDEIINQDTPAWEVRRKYSDGSEPRINHVDLIEVAPLQAALKLYAGRLHCERMQDLPYSPFTMLEDWQIPIVRDYNINDLDNTLLMWENLRPQIQLRESLGLEYGVDLRSKSDAQIAETVIVSELRKLGAVNSSPDIPVGTEFYYKPPEFVEFKTPQFQNVLRVVTSSAFKVGAGGYADCPQSIEALKPRLGIGIYKLGAGGLHSSEESVCYEADEDTLMIDRDVARYYPSIILNCELFPAHLGPPFLTVYRGIVTKRDMAKTRKDKITDQTMKIVINGSFGKLGNRYSKFYSPDLLIQVTMTGQLCLLMLIEMVELAGIPVVSANTDGIVIKCPKERYSDLEAVVIIWEEKTGFITEETRYRGIYSQNVNNYIAVKEKGGCKTKGLFSEVGSALNSPLSKNPEAYICSMAVQAFLEFGTPVEETIGNCRDIKRFVSVRTVKGGAEKAGVYLGKAIRWYYAQEETGAINYVLTGNKVPKTEGAKPCMILPVDFPADMDFDRYINIANEMLFDVGFFKRAKTGTLL